MPAGTPLASRYKTRTTSNEKILTHKRPGPSGGKRCGFFSNGSGQGGFELGCFRQRCWRVCCEGLSVRYSFGTVVLNRTRSGDFASALNGDQLDCASGNPCNHARRARKFLAAWSEAARKAQKRVLGPACFCCPLSALYGGGEVTGPLCDRHKASFIRAYIANAFSFPGTRTAEWRI